MKRVHDHKEDANPLTGSPVLIGESQGPRRGGGRKRKASGLAREEPVPQRQRAPAPIPHRAEQVLAQPQTPRVYHQAASSEDIEEPHRRTSQHRQRVLYSQWANQRELLARQMDFVQGPDDEANLQRLSQNVDELRRLSQEARRGG